MSFIQDVIDSLKWLTVWEMILCVLNLFVLLRYAWPLLKNNRWLDFIPSAGVIIAIISLMNGDASILALLIYSSTAILFLSTARRVFKPPLSRCLRNFALSWLSFASLVPFLRYWH